MGERRRVRERRFDTIGVPGCSVVRFGSCLGLYQRAKPQATRISDVEDAANQQLQPPPFDPVTQRPHPSKISIQLAMPGAAPPPPDGALSVETSEPARKPFSPHHQIIRFIRQGEKSLPGVIIVHAARHSGRKIYQWTLRKKAQKQNHL